LDDPEAAWGDERGVRVGLGFDLEWEALAPAAPDAAALDAAGGYRQWCEVNGEILVGPTARLTLAGQGGRTHRWGPAALPEAAAPPSPDPAGAASFRAPLLAGRRRIAFEVAGDRWVQAGPAG
ncbi:MAG: hypothetical protein QOG64_1289, partial [Acidimicrobiaceae bacterium]|nr:hypothetical protein [Acidimicrobiaceae bacterium]